MIEVPIGRTTAGDQAGAGPDTNPLANPPISRHHQAAWLLVYTDGSSALCILSIAAWSVFMEAA